MALNTLSLLPAAPGIDWDPATKARSLIAFWYERWGACQRFSDQPIELGRLRHWASDIALFDLMDYGADFRARTVGRKLIPLLGGRDWSGSRLSELPSPHRQDLRRILLRASMMRKPTTERYDWLVAGHLCSSCTACAMPVAGELSLPTRLLLGVFCPAQESNQMDMADRAHAAIDPRLVRPALSTAAVRPRLLDEAFEREFRPMVINALRAFVGA
jgi:hypothetical protein